MKSPEILNPSLSEEQPIDRPVPPRHRWGQFAATAALLTAGFTGSVREPARAGMIPGASIEPVKGFNERDLGFQVTSIGACLLLDGQPVSTPADSGEYQYPVGQPGRVMRVVMGVENTARNFDPDKVDIYVSLDGGRTLIKGIYQPGIGVTVDVDLEKLKPGVYPLSVRIKNPRGGREHKGFYVLFFKVTTTAKNVPAVTVEEIPVHCFEEPDEHDKGAPRLVQAVNVWAVQAEQAEVAATGVSPQTLADPKHYPLQHAPGATPLFPVQEALEQRLTWLRSQRSDQQPKNANGDEAPRPQTKPEVSGDKSKAPQVENSVSEEDSADKRVGVRFENSLGQPSCTIEALDEDLLVYLQGSLKNIRALDGSESPNAPLRVNKGALIRVDLGNGKITHILVTSKTGQPISSIDCTQQTVSSEPEARQRLADHYNQKKSSVQALLETYLKPLEPDEQKSLPNLTKLLRITNPTLTGDELVQRAREGLPITAEQPFRASVVWKPLGPLPIRGWFEPGTIVIADRTPLRVTVDKLPSTDPAMTKLRRTAYYEFKVVVQCGNTAEGVIPVTTIIEIPKQSVSQGVTTILQQNDNYSRTETTLRLPVGAAVLPVVQPPNWPVPVIESKHPAPNVATGTTSTEENYSFLTFWTISSTGGRFEKSTVEVKTAPSAPVCPPTNNPPNLPPPTGAPNLPSPGTEGTPPNRPNPAANSGTHVPDQSGGGNPPSLPGTPPPYQNANQSGN